MSEPTPGPWQSKVNNISNGITPWRIVGADEQLVAESPIGPHAFNKDNAKLIAAAPELRDALREPASRKCEGQAGRIDYVDCQCWTCKARAAIEKAG